MSQAVNFSPITLSDLSTTRRLVETLHRAGYMKEGPMLRMSNGSPNYQYEDSTKQGLIEGEFYIWPTLRSDHAHLKGRIGIACWVFGPEAVGLWRICDSISGGGYFLGECPEAPLCEYHARFDDLGWLVDQFIDQTGSGMEVRHGS